MTGIAAEYITHMGDDRLVVNAARVSFKKWVDEMSDGDERLIRYLAEHQHISPFFHPQICMRVTAPIFVANQAKRHQVGFAINEVSRRYVDDDPEFWRPEVWRTRPDKSIKQGSGDAVGDGDNSRVMAIYRDRVHQAKLTYTNLVASGVAPEMARAVLPQSMLTQWIWTGSLYAWGRLCRQRLDSHAQLEIQELAQQISDIVQPLFPVSWVALMEAI